MAVAYDASSKSGTGASGTDLSWTHTPTGTPAGVIVFVGCNGGTPTIDSVTYGGVPLTPVADGLAVDATGEAGSMQAFALGASIPTGPQTVAVDQAGSLQIWASCVTFTASADTEVVGVVTVEGDSTLAEVNINDGLPGTNSVRLAGLFTGLNSPPSAGANSTIAQEADDGTQCFSVVRETTAGQGSRPVGWSSGSTDDIAAVYLAVREVSAHRTIIAGGTTFEITANAATPSRLFTAAAAAFTLTGKAATPKHGRKVTAAKATFSVTGIAAGITATRKASALHAVFQLTGRPAQMTQALYALESETADFAVTANDAGLSAGDTLTAEAAAFSVTANDAPSTAKLPADAAAFSVTGQAAGGLISQGMPAATGAFTLTGIAAGVTATRKVTAEKAAFNVTGLPTAFPPRKRLILSLKAAFTLTGGNITDIGTLKAERASFGVTVKPADMLYEFTGGRSFTAFRSRMFQSRSISCKG